MNLDSLVSVKLFESKANGLAVERRLCVRFASLEGFGGVLEMLGGLPSYCLIAFGEFVGVLGILLG